MSAAPNRVLEVLPNAEAVARRAADVVAAAAREAIAARGRFTFALSGGRSPWAMFRDLADEDVPWERVGIWQVDERVAPDGDPDRNLTSLMPVIPSGADLRHDARDGTRPGGGGRPLRGVPTEGVRASCTSGWATTATPRRSCRAIRSSTRPTATSR